MFPSLPNHLRVLAFAMAVAGGPALSARVDAEDVASAAASASTQVSVQSDVEYGNIDGVSLAMDVALPPSETRNGAAVMVIHGGGWQGGRRQAHSQEIRELARRGYVACTVSYRLAPEHRFPAAVDDCRLATRFLRQQSEQYGFEADRIGAMGFSAGAHLAMMLGVVDPDDGFEPIGGLADYRSDVQAVVAYFGPTDLAQPTIPQPAVPILENFLGGSREEKLDDYRRASPVQYVDPQDAPMLLFQGTRDPLVPFDQAVRMADRMTRENVAGRVELLIGESHGWGGETLQHTREMTLEFLAEHLGVRNREPSDRR